MTSDLIDILFLGDIVGKPGRTIVNEYLQKVKKGEIHYGSENFNNTIKSGENSGFIVPDFVVANVENSSHGFGLTERTYNFLSEIGIDAFTAGNHIWDKKEIFNFIDKADKLVRPLNYPDGTPGEGFRFFSVNEVTICVINMLGRVFMSPIENPWSLLEQKIEMIKEKADIVLIDFHAEATAEKVTYGYFADELGVSAVFGTHTHVQTADERILKNGCGFISDAGLCGAIDGVIGMDYATSFKRLRTSLPERFDVAPANEAELNGVRILVNTKSGKTEKIERIKYKSFISEVNDNMKG